LVVIYSLSSQLPGMPAEASSAISLAQVRLWWLLVLSLVGLAATGALRLSYWREQASPDELKAKRAALVVKHIAFLITYGAGSVWAYSLVFPVA
jgi:ABC-type sulfate transport system permease component